MLQEGSSLFAVIILISLLFFLIALSLVLSVAMYNRRKKKHLEEKKEMNQKFESELLKTHLEVQEQTMQAIAAELHDNIGQLLSLTTLTLSSIEFTDLEKSKKKIASSLTLVNKSIKELRGLAKLLHGEQIITYGLGKVIQQEINWLKRVGRYKLKAKNELLHMEVRSAQKDLIILRLLQEIINNILKHAQATEIEIDASLTAGILHLAIRENGVGFNYEDVKAQQKGIGLSSIHKRVEMIEGTIEINSKINKGTTTIINVPYP